MVSVITYSFQLLSDCLFHSDGLTVDPFTMATRWDVIGMRNVWRRLWTTLCSAIVITLPSACPLFVSDVLVHLTQEVTVCVNIFISNCTLQFHNFYAENCGDRSHGSWTVRAQTDPPPTAKMLHGRVNGGPWCPVATEKHSMPHCFARFWDNPSLMCTKLGYVVTVRSLICWSARVSNTSLALHILVV